MIRNLVVFLYWIRLSSTNQTISITDLLGDNKNGRSLALKHQQNLFNNRKLIWEFSGGEGANNFSCADFKQYSFQDDADFFEEEVEVCQFALMFDCLVDHLTEERLFLVFNDKRKHNYVKNLINKRKNVYSFYLNTEDAPRLLINLRAFVISILTNHVDVVVSFLTDNVFKILLEVWMKEGQSKTLPWLHTSSAGALKLYFPKCENSHQPSSTPIKESTILGGEDNRICRSKSIAVLKEEIKRCRQRKFPVQPPLIGVLKVEAPWVILVPGEWRNGRLHCPKNCLICSMPRNNGTTTILRDECCSGYMVHLFLQIAAGANIKNYSVYGVSDNKYGGIVSCPDNDRSDPTKCIWSGLIDELMQKKADIAITSLTFNEERASVSDFSEYVGLSPMGMVRHKTEQNQPLLNFQFAKTLDPSLTIAMLVTFVLTYFVALIIENAANARKKRSFYTIHETLTYLAGLTFQRDLGGRNPYFWSARLPSIMYAFATTIIMTTYTADLTAKGVVFQTSDFGGLKDERITNPTSEFLYSLPTATNTYRYFSQNVDERYRRGAHRMAPYQSSIDLEGVEKVFSGEVDGFISDYASLFAVVSLAKYCSYLILENFDNPQPYSFALQKNSKFLPFFSNYIQDMRMNGRIDILKKKWQYESSKCAGAEATAEQFGWRYAFGLVAILIVTSLLCILILLMENLCSRYRRSR